LRSRRIGWGADDRDHGKQCGQRGDKRDEVGGGQIPKGGERPGGSRDGG